MNHLENAKLAMKYWLTVPPQNVPPDLCAWNYSPGKHTCWTIACFGGWVPAMPEFAAMGVTADEFGAPKLPGTSSVSEVANILFGEVQDDLGAGFRGHLFEMASDCAYDWDFDHDFDQFDRTEDHKLVVHRLESHIKYLESRQ